MMGRRASFALGSVVSSRASPASSIARIDITRELIAVAGLHPSGVSNSMQIPPPARRGCLSSRGGDAREGGGERTVKYVAGAVPQSRAEHRQIRSRCRASVAGGACAQMAAPLGNCQGSGRAE